MNQESRNAGKLRPLLPTTINDEPTTRGRAASTRHSSLVTRHYSSAFTLIEMIVVILIIGILAGLLFTGASSVFDRARRTQAKNDATQIVTAVNAFYTEYGQYPATAGADTTYGPNGTANNTLLDTLRAVTTTVNTRGIVFISPPFSKGSTGTPKGGISQVAATIGRYMDPWGTQYAVVLDTNYDNTVTNPYSDTDGSAGPKPSLPYGVIAYSYGKNGALGGGAAANSTFGAESGTAGKFKGSSDILSW